MKKNAFFYVFALLLLFSCNKNTSVSSGYKTLDFGDYRLAVVDLSADLTTMGEHQKDVVMYLIKAATYADSMFLYESAGHYAYLINTLKDSIDRLRFRINFGPWDRFDNNRAFVTGIGPKPKGANFYPEDMLPTEFKNMKSECKYSHYTFIRRDQSGNLYCVPYHKQFSHWIDQVVKNISYASVVSRDQQFSAYLRALAKALKSDSYYAVDSLWLGLDGDLDFAFGPLYISEDKLFSIKSEHQAYVLLTDREWTQRMERYTSWLKYLQKALPVPELYRREEPGSGSKIAVYNALYYGGSAHAGPIYFSVTLPFNPKFQMEQGGKTMMFKNVIFSKFNAVVRPMAQIALVKSQYKHVTDTAFFINRLMWEMASNLGIRHTVDGSQTVRMALKDFYSPMENIKNDLLILFLVEKLYSVGELPGNLKQYYYTFVVDLLRQIRWGAGSDYSLAALVIFNSLCKSDAIDFLPTGELILHYDAMKKSISNLLTNVLMIQGDGDYDKAAHFILKNKYISANLQKILQKFQDQKVPVDIYVNQGTEYLNFN